MGPLAVADMAGVDVGQRVRDEAKHLLKPGARETLVEVQLVKMGRLGQKTGAGWYKYDAERRANPDPEVLELVRQLATKAGVQQRQISEQEILDRCLYTLVNVGARILEEGYALRSGDIDTVYVNGYGYPAFRGGPMWYADTVGLKKVYERVKEFHANHGERWEPAPLLKKLAEEGKTFAEFEREPAMAGD
jgi:3-hydroxyacyl-CoA dehydrogenase